MISDILTAIALGRKLIETIANFRRAVQEPGSSRDPRNVASGKLEGLESRLAELESKTRASEARAIELEHDLQSALRATEALTERVSAIFWIASIGCGLGLVGLILSVIALTRAVR